VANREFLIIARLAWRYILSEERLRVRGDVHWREELVTALRRGRDQSADGRRRRPVPANLPDSSIQSHIKVNECVSGPQLLLKVRARYDSAGAGQQFDEHLERLLLQLYPSAVLA
jgi:hypothetical protein